MLDSFTFTHNGADYVAEIHHDADHGAPWQEEDGHGPVTDWTRRAKLPGELVLSQDRDRCQFYDFAEACRIALRDGWDAEPYNHGGMQTRRQQAAKAARADFRRLRAWCDNEWSYIGLVVRPAGACACCGLSESLWGIESDADDYLREVAEELADQLSAEQVAA